MVFLIWVFVGVGWFLEIHMLFFEFLVNVASLCSSSLVRGFVAMKGLSFGHVKGEFTLFI